MSRPLTGSVRRKGTGWEASVPVATGSSARASFYSANEAEARRWCDAAVAAVRAGQAMPDPSTFRSATPTASPAPARTRPHWLERAVSRWRNERFAVLRRGGPDRLKNVDSILRRHILPFFCERLATPRDYGRDVVLAFIARLGGEPFATYSIAEAAATVGVTGRAVRAKIAQGRIAVAGTTPSGARLVALGDVETAFAKPRSRVTNSTAYSREIFAVWLLIEAYLVEVGVLPRVVTQGLSVPEPHAATRKRTPRVIQSRVGLDQVVAVAGHLHVIHQLVLFFLALVGMRISEVYGIRVGDILNLDTTDAHGIVVVERQGGRPFLVHDADGRVVRADTKDKLKTTESVRTITIAPLLMGFLRIIVEVFHTDPHAGIVDLDARLVPGIRTHGTSGQAGFRNALNKAIGTELDDAGIEARFVPHDLRHSLITTMEGAKIDKVLARRFVGHAPGEDVHADYIGDPLPSEFASIADALQAETQDVVDRLPVPTTAFPAFGQQNPYWARRNDIRGRLVEIGAMCDATDDTGEVLLAAHEVAHELGVTAKVARRLTRNGHLASVTVDGERRVRAADLDAYRAAKLPSLRAVADRHGLDYHRLHRILRYLRLSPGKDPATGEFAVDEATEARVVAEARRVDALHARAVTVGEAARMLHRAEATVRQMLRRGELETDPETDATGAQFIPRAAIRRRQGMGITETERWADSRA